VATVKIQHYRNGHDEEHTFHLHGPEGDGLVSKMHKHLTAHSKRKFAESKSNYGETPRALEGPEKKRKVRRGRRLSKR